MSRISTLAQLVLAAALVAMSIPPDRGVHPGAASASAQANATVVLTPSSGPAPSVTGSLSGTGWCAGASVTVTSVPPGLASGSGNTGRGALTGNFTVTGSPGQVVTINVAADCREGSSARANFRFDDPTPVPRPTATFTPTETPVPLPTPTDTPTPSPTASPTATSVHTPTASPVATSTQTPTPTSTRPVSPTSTSTLAATSTLPPAPSPTPAQSPIPGQGSVRVLGCSPAADSVSVRVSLAGGAAPPGGFADLNLPAVQAPSPQTFAFVLPPTGPAGTLFNLLPQVDDPGCPPSETTPVLWDPAAGAPPTLYLPSGSSKLSASSHGSVMPGGDVVTWVTMREFKGNIAGTTQLFKFESTAAFDHVYWQVSLQPFSGAFDPLDPDPAGKLAEGAAACAGAGACVFAVNFSDFIPAPPTEASSAWSTQLLGAMFEPVPLFKVAQGAASKSAGSPDPPKSDVTAVLPSGQLAAPGPAIKALLAPPKEFYFRAIPAAAGTLLGPQSNTVTLRWTGPYGGADPTQVKFPDCSTTPELPACKWKDLKPESYTVKILTYHGWLSPKDGHRGCYLVTETTTAPLSFGQELTYKEGQQLCPPEPKDPGILAAIVNFVVDAVNWVANTYAKLKEAVIDLVSQFVPASLCDKSCIGVLLDAALVSLGIPPSLPNFDQLLNEGVDYLAATAVEQIGVPKALQDMAAGPAKDIAIEEFQKVAKQQIKEGIQAGIKEMQKNLSSQVAWIPDGVPIKPDPLGEYQPPAMTFRVTRKAGGSVCPGVFLVSGVVTNTTPAGISELAGKTETWLYEPRYVDIPSLEPGQSVDIPVSFKPQLSYGFAGAKYHTHSHAVAGWWKLYSGGMLTLSTGGGSCVGGGDTLKTPAEASLLGGGTGP